MHHSALSAHLQWEHHVVSRCKVVCITCRLHSFPRRLTCHCRFSRFLRVLVAPTCLFLKPLPLLLLRCAAVEMIQRFRWSGMSGRMAQNTGYKPNFHSHLYEEHAPLVSRTVSSAVTTPPPSQLPKIQKFLTREHPAAASKPQRAEFPTCQDL